MRAVVDRAIRPRDVQQCPSFELNVGLANRLATTSNFLEHLKTVAHTASSNSSPYAGSNGN